MECDINEVKEIFEIKITNKKNIEKFNKYKNALKYGMKSIHRQLQNMDFNCISTSDKIIGELLLGRIYLKNTNHMNYSYPLSKIIYLKEKDGDKLWALKMYSELLEVFRQYVCIEPSDLDALSYEELYVLSQIALYFHSLEYTNVISKLIPKSDTYR